MIEKTLNKLGLSDKEIKVYLSCLKFGPLSVRKIAAETEINRGTAYDVLKSLIELGLMSYYHQDKHQYFIAEDPSRLNVTLEKRQQELVEVKSEVADIIPQLKSIFDHSGSKPVMKLYDGLLGLKVILQDVISSCQAIDEKNYYVFSSSAIKKYLYESYSSFSDDRIQAGISVKVISIGPGGQTQGLDERKWLTEKESAPTYTLIYAGKVAMISVDNADKPIGVIIKDANIFQTQKMIFEFIWDKVAK
ncbi:MAG: helix-turn-helix domain-containing protein [Candidatus Buchananbacteria bacterium]